ncbi:MAG: hypothetical protein ABJO86_14390 [Lentilitoribacter sp.]
MDRTQNDIEHDGSNGKTNDLALGGASILALLTASCCILPLGLAIVGLGGSWLSVLAPFIEYRVYLLTIVGLIVLWSWVSLYSSPCGLLGNKKSLLIRLFVTIIFTAALTAPYWEDGIARLMWEYLRDNR